MKIEATKRRMCVYIISYRSVIYHQCQTIIPTYRPYFLAMFPETTSLFFRLDQCGVAGKKLLSKLVLYDTMIML